MSQPRYEQLRILFLEVPAAESPSSLQVRFALSSSPVFSRTDTATDSERFYSSVLDLFEDTDEKEEVKELMIWWNRYANQISL
jgi:hypothetical protein